MMALSFDGVDDKVDFGDINAIDGSSLLTVCVWYKPTAASDAAVIWGKVASVGGDAADLVLWHGVGDGSVGADFAFVMGTTAPKGRVAGIFSAGVWVHLAIVYDGGGAANADRLKLYVNGVAQTVTFSGTIPASIGSSADTVTIGTDGANAWDLDGVLAHLKVWTAALTAAEVAQEMESARPARTANLVQWSPLDDGVSAKDYSGSGNHGTVTGAVQIAGPPVSYGSE
ncbi:MAG TPA: hypothetical protein DCQ64_15530 [Candidatus Rokubacteria bacterium]|nr:hypothetical protein [Candidatus Rokubacteria bacterium]